VVSAEVQLGDLTKGNATAATPGSGVAVLLLAATVFLGAFLLFLLEPLFAKLILPWFGGSAAVWATCLVFFQSALLLGYVYADVTTRRLSPRQQSLLHNGLLAACLAFLPITAHASWRPSSGTDPAWRILGLLTVSIGLPFVLLSATSPLVQAWHARLRPAVEPYHLFALSNFASLLALLSFPFWVAPRLSSHQQAGLWSALFGLFVLLCASAAWISRRSFAGRAPIDGAASTESATAPQPAPREKMLWLGLSACGSMLLLSITNHLTENVAPIPLLWVVPLGLYLLTFAMAFNRPSLYSRWLMVRLLAVALGSLGSALYDPSFTKSLQVSMLMFCAALLVCCLFCHGELARRRPAARYLTSFYLMISLGGALGAIFVGLIAPHVFAGVYELPLAVAFTTAFGAALYPQGRLTRAAWVGGTIAMIVVLGHNVHTYRKDVVLAERNFYGPVRIKLFYDWLKQPYYTLYNGIIEHGAQFQNPPQSLAPTTYYGQKSGVGIALDYFAGAPARVGVIGLGAGTVAAYGKSGDYFRFYDINPLVSKLATSSFTYLRDTPAKTDIVMGDARLSLEREQPPQNFDVLAVDAFSGDAIPVHLLTREAFALYLHHLKPDGVLAIHTSNTYLNLEPVVKLLADDAGYSANWVSNDDDRRKLIDASDWVLITRNKRFVEELETSAFVETIVVPPKLRLWTDDYNNLSQILRPISFDKDEGK